MSARPIRSRIVADSVWIVIATTVAQVVTAVTGIIIKRLLGPGDVAAWAFGSAVLGYLALTQLGVLETILLRTPLLMARRGESLRGLVGPGLFWILVVAVPATLGVLAFCLWSGGRTSPRNLLGLALSLPLLIPFQVATLGVTLARARGDFVRLAIATVVNGLVAGVLGVALVYALGLVGQAIAYGLGIVAQLVIFARYAKPSVGWRDRLTARTCRTSVAMVRYGLPYQSGSAIFSIRHALDTVLGVMFLGPVAAGVYAVAASFRSYLVALPTAFGTVLYRSLRTHHGRLDPAAANRSPTEWWLNALAVNYLTLVLPGSLVMSLLAPPLVRWFLPRFEGAPVLVALVPLAAATRMMEPIPLQRLLAVAATRRFLGVSALGLASMVLGALPGLFTRSGVVLLLGVAAAGLTTFAFAMVQALGQTSLTMASYVKVSVWCAAGFALVVLVSCVGYVIQTRHGPPLGISGAAAVTLILGAISWGAGWVLARQMSRGADA